ncbi:MAG: carbohydrate porin [Candidatus Omnitrophota bacterium]
MQFKNKLKCFAVMAMSTMLINSAVFGDDSDLNAEILREMRKMRELVKSQGEKIEQLEVKLKQQSKEITTSRERTDKKIKDLKNEDVSKHLKRELALLGEFPGGLEIGAEATFVGQGVTNANNAGAADGRKDRFDGSYSADIEIANRFDDYGMAFILLEAGQGDGVERELTVLSNVNRDAGNSGASVDLSEAWYEHSLFNGKIAFTAGKIDASNYIDTNEYANDETSQFLGHMFRNSAVIGWPDDNALGLRAYLSPEFTDFLDIELVYMDETGDWENLFDNPFLAAQLNLMPAKVFGYDEEMWGGNYRALFWYNGAAHPKIKEPDLLKRGSVGFGFSMGQKITDVYGIFGRFGWAYPERNDFAYDWSCGAQMTGKYWNREDDVIAIAIGQVIPGKDYKDVNDHHKAETHMEAYYSFKVNDRLTVSPDIQMIWDPNGGGTDMGKDRNMIFVYGVRCQAAF